jgi:hypothetical protein
MTNVGEIVQVTKELVGQLTDVVGLVEKNISSFDRIAARYRRKRVTHRLETILQTLTTMHHSCLTTLWLTAKLAWEKGDQSLSKLHELDFTSADFDLRSFLHSLLDIRDIIDEYKSDIINTDYTVYERLEDCIYGRIRVVNMLLENDDKQYSIDKLKAMYVAYAELIVSLKKVKDDLASHLKESTIS